MRRSHPHCGRHRVLDSITIQRSSYSCRKLNARVGGFWECGEARRFGLRYHVVKSFTESPALTWRATLFPVECAR
jgi:hypothetical protein